MSARRLLLIDSDDNFFRILHEQVSPYGFEIYRIEEHPDALNHVQEVSPQLIFIAVEEPDKVGYSLCNKAKKGVATDIPVILTTSSVPPSGFHSHRKLKVHADEYIDKRTMSTEELIGKIDTLIGLGGPPIEEMSFDDVEEFDISDDSFEDGDKTRIAMPQMLLDADIDPEAEAAVETLMAGFEDDDGLPADAGEMGETTQDFPLEQLPPDEPPPPPQSGARRDSGPVPVQTSASSSGPVPVQTSARRSGPAPRAQAAEEPQPPDPQLVQRLQTLERENEQLKADLGAAKQSTSASAGSSSFSREREFLNLRETINKKEREVLDLRDELGSKERQILEGKEQISQLQHSKTALDSKNLELEQRLLEISEQFEAEKAGAKGQVQELTGQVQEQQARVQELESQLESAGRENAQVAAELDAAKQTLANEVARLESERDSALAEVGQKHADELAATRQALEQQGHNALEALRGDYEGKLSALSAEHEQALERQKGEHQAALEAALAEAQDRHNQELAARDGHYQGQIQAERDKHAQELEGLKSEHAGEVARLGTEHQSTLAEAEARHKAELDHKLAEAEQNRVAAEGQLRQSFAAEKENQESAHAAVLAEKENERVQLEAGLSSARQSASELEQSLAQANAAIGERDQTIEQNRGELARQTEHIGSLTSEIESLKSQLSAHQSEIGSLKNEIGSLKNEVEELETQNAGYQEQVLKAFQKIKSDEATVAKAKKALAIALTLLDENITGAGDAASPGSGSGEQLS